MVDITMHLSGQHCLTSGMWSSVDIMQVKCIFRIGAFFRTLIVQWAM